MGFSDSHQLLSLPNMVFPDWAQDLDLNSWKTELTPQILSQLNSEAVQIVGTTSQMIFLTGSVSVKTSQLSSFAGSFPQQQTQFSQWVWVKWGSLNPALSGQIFRSKWDLCLIQTSQALDSPLSGMETWLTWMILNQSLQTLHCSTCMEKRAQAKPVGQNSWSEPFN